MSSDNESLTVESTRADAKKVDIDIQQLQKKPTRRILKRKIKKEKKLATPKSVYFRTYRPMTHDDDEDNDDIQMEKLSSANVSSQSVVEDLSFDVFKKKVLNQLDV